MAYSFQKLPKTIQKFTYNFNKYYNKKQNEKDINKLQ